VPYNLDPQKASDWSGAERQALLELASDAVFRRTLRKLCDEMVVPAESVLQTSDEMKEIWKARGKIEALNGLLGNIESYFDQIEAEKEKDEEHSS
jgi:hypothetical protein